MAQSKARARDLAPEERGGSFEAAAAANSATDPAQEIAAAARLLADSIGAARAAGYVVQMAFPVEALDRITVSATAKALREP